MAVVCPASGHSPAAQSDAAVRWAGSRGAGDGEGRPGVRVGRGLRGELL